MVKYLDDVQSRNGYLSEVAPLYRLPTVCSVPGLPKTCIGFGEDLPIGSIKVTGAVWCD